MKQVNQVKKFTRFVFRIKLIKSFVYVSIDNIYELLKIKTKIRQIN